MSASNRLNLAFVDSFPDETEENTLYISIPFASAMHKCRCGCGMEVITPISPTDWKLTYDGVSIWLYPSIGNWEFPCRSHYWIRESRVDWAPSMTQAEIERGRERDRSVSAAYFEVQAKEDAKNITPNSIPKTISDMEKVITKESRVTKSSMELLREWLQRLNPWR